MVGFGSPEGPTGDTGIFSDQAAVYCSVELCTKATEQNCPDLTEPITTVAMSLLI